MNQIEIGVYTEKVFAIVGRIAFRSNETQRSVARLGRAGHFSKLIQSDIGISIGGTN